MIVFGIGLVLKFSAVVFFFVVLENEKTAKTRALGISVEGENYALDGWTRSYNS